MRKLIFSLFLLALSTTIVSAQQYDLMLEGGRIMDPETGVDAVRNVGIRDGKIVRVSSEALSGRRVVHAGGLVVAPGFIDLHQHGQDLASQRVKALDGVDELHNSSTTHWVVIFNNTQEVIDKVIPHHLVMISAMASKAIPVTPEPIRARWRNTSAKRERSR